ncbi:MAG: hypothetical protein M1832_004137 [Thelocarpon impressellum]|nr:MAG: hypothetical protein M1832_004137 [Thelocarpon impressellum]
MAGTAEKNVPGQASKPLSLPPHALSHQAVSTEIGANTKDGLTRGEVQRRLEEYGRNELDDGPGVQPLKILVRQVANAMTLVLIMAMVVSFGIRSWIEGGLIGAVIALNITIGFIQEFNAEKTMASLRSLSSPTAAAVRDGKTEVVPTAELVPGDMVELKTGDTVPADVRLLEAVNFETDEALLTGESLPVQKDSEATFDVDTGAGDRINVAFSSTTVTRGRARGIVFATGMATEIGSISTALRVGERKTRPVKRRADGSAKLHRHAQAWGLTTGDFIGHFLGINVGTPLQRRLSKLALALLGTAVVCAVIVLAANGFSSNTEVIIYAVATGLSMIPASLIVVLTVTVAAGTKRMVERHVIVRSLDSLEALGAVTDICSDKTGTLTQGRMLAKRAWIPAEGTYSVGPTPEPFNPTLGSLYHDRRPPSESGDKLEAPSGEEIHGTLVDLVKHSPLLEAFLDVASLANLAHVHESEAGWMARGDPTEIAIQVFASRFDWNRESLVREDGWKPVAEFPFDSNVKRMSVVFDREAAGKRMVFTKGAVERVLDSCKLIHLGEDQLQTSITDEMRRTVLENMEALAAQGLRVLALASRDIPGNGHADKSYDRDEIERELTFQGLLGIFDPPRVESADAVKKCHQAGVSVHMLTGDHPGTARAVAAQVGIIPSNPNTITSAMVMTAGQFDKLSDDAVDELPVLPLVIARCSPNTKVRMIEALHRRRRFVAMTGDGVNDSPSLKRADVGIAMGQTGSDVAKDASDIVLTDDNFASILNAVEEGRRMSDNIQKFVLHLLATNIAQACTLLIGLVFKDASGLSVFPLAPVEILWVIMITSGLPDMGLGVEAAAPDIMGRPAQSLRKGIFTTEVIVDTVVYGFWMAALCLASFAIVLFGFGDGKLGVDCNNRYSAECDTVFRARATTFVCLTWFALLLAWELVNMRRSFFRMRPGGARPWTQWTRDVWRNQFLFWGVVAGFVTIFPALYAPVISRVVFKHEGISWEWGVVFVEAVMFVGGVEAWLWAKRCFFRRQARGDSSADDANPSALPESGEATV